MGQSSSQLAFVLSYSFEYDQYEHILNCLSGKVGVPCGRGSHTESSMLEHPSYTHARIDGFVEVDCVVSCT